MASCLGLYIESKIIKYAKVSKEREVLKVESFGIKFYDKLGEAITQIVAETFSYKIPISVNLSEEMYNYFYMFNLLNKNDLKKAIETEFESFCFDRGLNRNALEGRYILSSSVDEKDKLKVIHISTNKTTVNRITQLTDEIKASYISPIGICISNVVEINNQKQNLIIVNMEETTTVTTVLGKNIYSVEKYEEGADEVLSKISSKENSYSKAYEICKNSTIYTMEGKELQDDENEYLDYIMPTLYKIVNKVQEYVADSTIKFDKIYITGVLSVINNIDLYFQEFFSNEKCEILKPYFITESVKINMKDYIEVNSAIALAIQGLDVGIKEVNFKKPSFGSGFFGSGGSKSKSDGEGKTKSKKGISLSGFDTKIDATERWMIRGASGLLLLTLIYSGFSIFLGKQINIKKAEVEDVRQYTVQQIDYVKRDNSLVQQKTNEYIEKTNNLKSISEKIESDTKYKNVIPNLLMQIMYTVPEGVQITEIENGSGNKVVIKAQSPKYEQLGYFKARIKEDNILKRDTVVSSQGEKTGEGDMVKIVIEGELP